MASSSPEPRAWVELAPSVSQAEAEVLCRGIAQPVAVTGGTGLVGSHLVEALVAGGIRPRVLVRDPSRLDPHLRGEVEMVRGDLGAAEVLSYLVGGCRTVVHCAGLIRAADEESFEGVNWYGTRNLLSAVESRGRNARVVHVSSLAAAGPSADPAGKRPEDVAMPISAYGRSKLAGEVTVRAYPESWVIVRPSAIYGPRDVDVFQFFKMASRGRVFLPSGERSVSINHVSDVVRALLAAAGGKGTGQVLHVGDPRTYRLEVLARVLAETGGVEVKIVHVSEALVRLAGAVGNLMQRLGADSVAMTRDKARELLARHWTAQTEHSLVTLGLPGWVPFPSGAVDAWQWYRDRGWLPRAKISEA